jgi:hypothetical protein
MRWNESDNQNKQSVGFIRFHALLHCARRTIAPGLRLSITGTVAALPVRSKVCSARASLRARFSLWPLAES